MKPALLVLAAGLATRYGGLKQLEPVGPAGEALLDYGVYDARRAGFGRILLVIRRAIDVAMRAHVVRMHQTPLTFVFQEGRPGAAGEGTPWGTAHAVLAAAGVIDEPFAVMNADDFYGRSAFEQMAAHLRTSSQTGEFAILTYPVAATLSGHGGVSRALCTVDDQGLLTGITELHDIVRRDGHIVGRSERGEVLLDEAAPVSMNLMGFTPAVFEPLTAAFAAFLDERGAHAEAEYRLPDAVSDMVGAGRCVRVLSSPGGWMGMTYAGDREQVRSQLGERVRAGEYPPDLATGPTGE